MVAALPVQDQASVVVIVVVVFNNYLVHSGKGGWGKGGH